MRRLVKNIVNEMNVGITALVLKIGPKILTIVAKFAKFGKVGLAIGSAVTYSYIFTWQFAAMIMVLLLIHEYGHIWAMKRCGLKTKGIYFIPFLGAAAVTEEMFKSRRDEAYIAIMGPIFGLVLSGIILIVYMMTQNAMFAAASGWMAMVNLFNLLPINPLDGGRIMKSITFSINSKLGYRFLIIGILISLVLILWAGIILFFFLLIIGSLEFLYEYRNRNGNKIIKRCVKKIDSFFGEDVHDEMKQAINNVKNMLLNEKEDPETRINTVIAVGKKLDNPKDIHGDIDFATSALSRSISPVLRDFDRMPRMTLKGVTITAISYIVTAIILWSLMTYTSHIPEVEIARQFFMS